MTMLFSLARSKSDLQCRLRDESNSTTMFDSLSRVDPIPTPSGKDFTWRSANFLNPTGWFNSSTLLSQVSSGILVLTEYEKYW